MRLLGCGLILWATARLWLAQRQRMLMPLHLAEALSGDLALLKGRSCAGGLPLPAILERELTEGPGAAALWQPLLAALTQEEPPALPQLWRGLSDVLPPPLDKLLAPLGPLLTLGGQDLSRAIDETREELTGFIRAERQRQATAQRLCAALCFSGALLVILVLI